MKCDNVVCVEQTKIIVNLNSGGLGNSANGFFDTVKYEFRFTLSKIQVPMS